MRSTDTWDPVRQWVAYGNEERQCFAQLIGICKGLLGDNVLTDQEIHFLRDWLVHNDAVAYSWPGSVIVAKVRDILSDGLISEAERAHLVHTLQELMGGQDVEMEKAVQPIALGVDDPDQVFLEGRCFVLTGDFVYGPRSRCEGVITARGGAVKSSVSRRTYYVVIGGLGSAEWKHGSFGTKIEKAMMLKREGAPILVIKEACWTRAIQLLGV